MADFLATTLAFGLTYSSLYYSDDYCFFLATTGLESGDLAFWRGDLATTAFLAGLTSSSELYSDSLSCLAGFLVATGLTNGDLATGFLATTLGFYYS